MFLYAVSSYFCSWMAMALFMHHISVRFPLFMRGSPWDGVTHLPLGSVCLDHVGVHLMTVDAQEGGKCSSNIVRYQ